MNMNEINIKGLEVSACHGVLPFEKTTPQPFIIDLSIDTDIERAAATDSVEDTVNYAEVCAEVSRTATEKSFNLIEKLAAECAFTVMDKFPSVSGVRVTVHKPCAPVENKFSDICVNYGLCRERVYLSLGSNMGDSENALNSALKSLGNIRGVKVKKISSFIRTQPYGGVAKNIFLNCAAEIECLVSPEKLLKEIHRIEAEAGRTRDIRWGDRTLDIDIIFFGSRIICSDALLVPHPDWLNRAFVIEPLKEIAPDLVCPVVNKRISDL